MSARIIDGKAIAAEIRADVKARAEKMRMRTGIVPGLATVLIGVDPASQIYVASKHKACAEAGFASIEHHYPDGLSEEQVLGHVARLNADHRVHGILVQLPLPKGIDEKKVLNAIDPAKDVDGFHPMNVGKLLVGEPAPLPCTPAGCMVLLEKSGVEFSGKRAVVVGRSNIVGKPAAILLLRRDCTVTIAHSKTKDLPAVVREADIVIAAVGRSEMIRGDWIKPGAAVIDVGMNRTPQPGGAKDKLTGDVHFASAKEVAGCITPVPGGVGPMTIAMLLRNTIEAAERMNP
ncbi:MAG TPA: bifunctional methylenetetrahydrofolate dehydrogenase/methenyltetrahydrofolate cyclohydrolase FolD [bacterium]|nr:bifunctional methylenetetrahydrofolate dehydrogenase/methenyltetrahydrofolate cyclohydrolase FolD [bacterium]